MRALCLFLYTEEVNAARQLEKLESKPEHYVLGAVLEEVQPDHIEDGSFLLELASHTVTTESTQVTVFLELINSKHLRGLASEARDIRILTLLSNKITALLFFFDK